MVDVLDLREWPQPRTFPERLSAARLILRMAFNIGEGFGQRRTCPAIRFRTSPSRCQTALMTSRRAIAATHGAGALASVCSRSPKGNRDQSRHLDQSGLQFRRRAADGQECRVCLEDMRSPRTAVLHLSAAKCWSARVILAALRGASGRRETAGIAEMVIPNP